MTTRPKLLTISELIAQENDIIADWFKNHRASLHKAVFEPETNLLASQVSKVVWRKPGTYCYYVSYLFDGPFLYVSGDLGESVFQWSERISPEWVGHCDEDYILGKLRACPTTDERGGKHWDGQWAVVHLQEQLNQAAEEYELTPLRWHEAIDLAGGWDANELICNRWEWEKFVSENEIPFARTTVNDKDGVRFKHTLPNDDGQLYGIGWRISLQLRGHVRGIQMAMKQLASQNSSPEKHQ